MGRLLQLICLFIDPGNIVEVPPYLRWFSLLVVVLGLILFCGLLMEEISRAGGIDVMVIGLGYDV